MKLGGSVLTDKARYRTPRLDIMGRLAQEVAGAPEPTVVVHGAGSYGHVVARTHQLGEGKGAPRDVAQVHGDVRELTGLLLVALREAGLAAVSHSTYDLARLDGGKLLHFAAQPVADSLAAGFTPVLSGDVALDASRRWGILSGDVLMVELARALRPARAVFVTDVDGIFGEDGALLARAGPHARLAPIAPGRPDVTGSMNGKLARARAVAQHAPTLVVNGLAAGRVADALAGKDVVGTRVES